MNQDIFGELKEKELGGKELTCWECEVSSLVLLHVDTGSIFLVNPLQLALWAGCASKVVQTAYNLQHGCQAHHAEVLSEEG